MAGYSAHHKALVQQLLIDLLLLLAHGCIQKDLLLAREADLNISLQAPQHEGLQQVVKLGDNLSAMLKGMAMGKHWLAGEMTGGRALAKSIHCFQTGQPSL